jgi:hypothetical protein
MDSQELRRLFEWLTSGRAILWIFASCVFGAYVVSLEAALFESIGYYGPMRIFTTGYLSNMVLPIQISIYVWILGSVLLLCGQLGAKPIHRDTVLVGAGSLAVSVLSQLTVGASLLSVKVPWFVSYLELTDATKLLIGIVSASALSYVVLSPLVWRKKFEKEIADDLKDRVVNEVLDQLEEDLDTDRSEIQPRDISFYVETGSIKVSGLCTTRDGKRARFRATLSQPDLRLGTMFTETEQKKEPVERNRRRLPRPRGRAPFSDVNDPHQNHNDTKSD